MKAVVIIDIAILIIIFFPLCVSIEYSSKGFIVKFMSIFTVYPMKKRGKPKEKNMSESGKNPESKAPGKLSAFIELLPVMREILGLLRKKLTVSKLTLRYISAADNAYNAAMNFGYFNAGIGIILNPLCAMLNIRKKDIKTCVSFTESEPYLYINIKLNILLCQLLYIGIRAILELKSSADGRKEHEYV